MKNTKITEEDFAKRIPEECVMLMYERTGENGELIFPEWPYDTDDEVDVNDGGSFDCIMKWDENERDGFIADFRELCHAFEKIAASYDSFDDLNEALCSKRASDAGEFSDVFNKYLRRLDADSEDADALRNAAAERLGRKPAALRVIQHSRRLCALIALDASEVLKENEAKTLAQAMAVNDFAESITLSERP